MLLFFGPCQTLANRVHPTEQLEINSSYVFVIHRGHPLLFHHTVTSLNLPQPPNRTPPWTWGLIVQRCLPSSASARCACLYGSGSWHHPRCGIGSLFLPRCETGSSCPPRCETGSSVLPKRLRWSQKRCGTSSAWSCLRRGLEEESFINALLHGLGRKPLPSSPALTTLGEAFEVEYILFMVASHAEVPPLLQAYSQGAQITRAKSVARAEGFKTDLYNMLLLAATIQRKTKETHHTSRYFQMFNLCWQPRLAMHLHNSSCQEHIREGPTATNQRNL